MSYRGVGLLAVLEVIDEEGTEVGKLWTVDWILVDRESKVLLTLIDSVEVRERQFFSNFITWALRSEISEWRIEMDKKLDLIQKGDRKGYLSATVGAMLTQELWDQQEQLSQAIMWPESSLGSQTHFTTSSGPGFSSISPERIRISRRQNRLRNGVQAAILSRGTELMFTHRNF